MEVNGIRSAQELAAPLTQSDPTDNLGKNQFLELMIAQFNNQDPLDPTDNGDFIAQLAQFSSLEGIQNLNSSMTDMAMAMRSSATLDAAALVGRAVLITTDQTFLTDAGLSGEIRNPEPSTGVQVEISTLTGDVVRRIELGSQGEGDARFTWDGTNERGEPQPLGAYRLRAFATIGGEKTELEMALPDRVVSVSFDERGAMANLAAGTSVSIDLIKEIQ